VIKIKTIKRNQMMNSERTRLSSKMLMIGQLNKRVPRTNKNIQTSLLIRMLPLSLRNPRTAGEPEPGKPGPEAPEGVNIRH
jgi:hypothetical protein